MTPAIAPPITPIPALAAWLTAAELMLRDMGPADPRYAPALDIWQERLAEYEGRALVEGEPE